MRWRVCDNERERAFQGSDVCAGNARARVPAAYGQKRGSSFF